MYLSTYEIILYGLSGFTILLQFYVVYLILKKSPNTMQEYRFFLIIFAFWDLVFTLILGLFLQAIPITPMLAGKVHGLAYFMGDFGCRLTTAAAIYTGANVIMCQDYCLTYRFCVLHQNKLVHRAFMSVYFKIGYLIFSQALSISLGWAMYNTLLPYDQAYKTLMQQTIEVKNQVQPTDVFIFIEFEYTFTKNFFMLVVALFTLSEIICFTLIFLIMSILKQNSNLFSKNTYKLHIQFTVLLAIQLITPLIFVVAPVTVCIIAAFMVQPSSEMVTEIGLIMLTLYGMTNGLFTILFVSPYRNHAFNTFVYFWLKPLMIKARLSKYLPADGQRISSLTFAHNITKEQRLRRRNSVFVSGFFSS